MAPSLFEFKDAKMQSGKDTKLLGFSDRSGPLTLGQHESRDPFLKVEDTLRIRLLG